MIKLGMFFSLEIVLVFCSLFYEPQQKQVTKPVPTAKVAPAPAKCPAPVPICAGGLLPANASIAQVNAYWVRWKLTVPLTCRFQRPPRCQTGKKPICGSCTP